MLAGTNGSSSCTGESSSERDNTWAEVQNSTAVIVLMGRQASPRNRIFRDVGRPRPQILLPRGRNRETPHGRNSARMQGASGLRGLRSGPATTGLRQHPAPKPMRCSSPHPACRASTTFEPPPFTWMDSTSRAFFRWADPGFELLFAEPHAVLSARGEPRTEHDPYEADSSPDGHGQDVLHGQLPRRTADARPQRPSGAPHSMGALTCDPSQAMTKTTPHPATGVSAHGPGGCRGKRWPPA
ncbi:hypothetical protein BX264_7057 [Streptomyces sp. 2333.5]|nr:hypothetical protein BX264_7057 [Streptomyces sp. 2333.5]SEE96514.1 hypothetical protein SAMN05428943_7158 [Streptomyces sp. 2314.4]SEF10754.1 hypothetical protein SAMN05428942_7157 [Streptomyces sp. 2112.2]